MNNGVVETERRVKPTRVANVECEFTIRWRVWSHNYDKCDDRERVCLFDTDDDRDLYEFVPRVLSKKIKVKNILQIIWAKCLMDTMPTIIPTNGIKKTT